MPAISGDPNHGSLAFQEATHTMLRWSESLEVKSSTRNTFNCFLCLKYLEIFTWIQSINNLFVHSFSLHMSWNQFYAFCFPSSMIEEAGLTRRPLDFMKDVSTAGGSFNWSHEVAREAWNLRKPSPVIFQISNYCCQALGAHVLHSIACTFLVQTPAEENHNTWTCCKHELLITARHSCSSKHNYMLHTCMFWNVLAFTSRLFVVTSLTGKKLKSAMLHVTTALHCSIASAEEQLIQPNQICGKALMRFFRIQHEFYPTHAQQ